MNWIRDRVAALLKGIFDRVDRFFGRTPKASQIDEEILCDTCKYNYGNVCTRPERPNATQCEDYKKK